MLVSDRFLKQLKRIRRRTAAGPDGGVPERAVPEDRVIAEVREAFFDALGPQPEGLKHDIFNHYVKAYYDRPESGRGRFLDAAEGLCPVIDLFRREYGDASRGVEAGREPDGERDPYDADQGLSDEELDFLKIVVDAYAVDIDIDVVTDIMKLLLARGRI